MTDELTKALLLEEVASEEAIAAALFASVTGDVPLVQALTDTKAVTSTVLARYLARTDAPHLQKVAPLLEAVSRLPAGLCVRLLALPVRRDAITGTIDVVVADANDQHPGAEIAFHLGAPVRLVRASVAAIEEALHRLRVLSTPAGAVDELRPPDDERLYDSRRALSPSSVSSALAAARAPSSSSASNAASAFRGNTLPPADPALRIPASQVMLDAFSSEALKPSRVPVSHRQAHVLPGLASVHQRPSVTPPWGTQVHPESDQASPASKSEPPRSGLGSEIPIPLTRRTFAAVSGGTQRPPPLVDPADAMGEGYAVDAGHFRQIVEVSERSRIIDPRSGASTAPGAVAPPAAGSTAVDVPMPSFIPGPPPLPGGANGFNAFAAQVALSDIGGILAALRAAGSRDEVLELVLTGARMVARKVGIFVVKRGGYLGWACTPELGDRASLQAILIPVESASIFDEAVRDGLYLGPLRHDEVHAALLHVMRGASRDVAAVPIRVSGKTAVVVLADELGDTMLATRRLEELARAAGESFARIVRMRR